MAHSYGCCFPDVKQIADWLDDPTIDESEKDKYLESQLAPLREKRIHDADRRAASERVEVQEVTAAPGSLLIGQRRRLKHNGGVM